MGQKEGLSFSNLSGDVPVKFGTINLQIPRVHTMVEGFSYIHLHLIPVLVQLMISIGPVPKGLLIVDKLE